MNKTCQNCKKDFVIDEWDQLYYKKINVPHPTWCPACRFVRRVSNINGFTVFYRNCDKCGKRTLSAYPPSQKITVYCQPCWWGDTWDGTEYEMEYDPSRNFLEQVKELSEKTPYCALETTYLTLKDCEYCNAIAYSKNCILASWSDYCENVCYSGFNNGVKDTSDCLRMQDSELCYESIGQNKSYRTLYSEECDSCTDVWFSRNCYGCTNCIGCVNLRGASYSIFNVKYSKEEYIDKLKEMRLDTRTGIKKTKEEAEKFWKTFPYRAYSGNTFNLNTTGEYVYGSKNSKEMYVSNGAEDCRNCQFITVAPARDCMDYSGWGNNAQLIYESANIGDNVSNVKFSCYCFPDVLNTEYSMWVIAGKNNFGCVNLKRKQYAILNKVYDQETYEKLKEQIIESMKNDPYIDKLGRKYYYGEFFPPEFGKYSYNTSNANKFIPKTKEQAESEGYFWHEEPEAIIEFTIYGKNLPDTLVESGDAILDEVIACTTCPKKYKIIQLEYSILQRLNIPIPDQCPKCRGKARFAKINPPIFYERNCAKCNTEITTAFAPERQEIIYCEKCYQGEFV
ncbi:hypothetical protein IT400_00290 [Candidatus Nomurabacteria bacterium]|nr:hypothetical protein [Candidatus Nomurabacteria bacterium]